MRSDSDAVTQCPCQVVLDCFAQVLAKTGDFVITRSGSDAVI
jgi:hypothetical protein